MATIDTEKGLIIMGIKSWVAIKTKIKQNLLLLLLLVFDNWKP